MKGAAYQDFIRKEFNLISQETESEEKREVFNKTTSLNIQLIWGGGRSSV